MKAQFFQKNEILNLLHFFFRRSSVDHRFARDRIDGKSEMDRRKCIFYFLEHNLIIFSSAKIGQNIFHSMKIAQKARKTNIMKTTAARLPPALLTNHWASNLVAHAHILQWIVKDFANGKQAALALQSRAWKFSSKMKITQKSTKISTSTNSSKRCQTGRSLRISFLSSLLCLTSWIQTREMITRNLRRLETSRSGRKSPVWRMSCWKLRKKFYKRKLLLEEKSDLPVFFSTK